MAIYFEGLRVIRQTSCNFGNSFSYTATNLNGIYLTIYAAFIARRINHIPVRHSQQHHYIQFHPSAISLLGALPVEVCLSLNVIEHLSETERDVKEVQLQHVTPSTFSLADI